MIGMRSASIADRPHRVSLTGPGGVPVPDGDGGFTVTAAALDPPAVWAQITPATAADLERLAAGTVLASATLLVTMPFHAGVNTNTQLAWTDAFLRPHAANVVGVVNVDERCRELIVGAVEILTSAGPLPPVVDASPPAEPLLLDTVPDTTVASGLCLGNTFTFLVAGELRGGRFWRTADSPTGRVMTVYTPLGAVRATSDPATDTSGTVGWTDVTFTPPLPVAANDKLVLAFESPTAHFYKVGLQPTRHPDVAVHVAGNYTSLGGGMPVPGGDYSYFADGIFAPDVLP